MIGMFQVSASEKLKVIPFMFLVEALIYISSHVKECMTFGEAIKALQKWCNNADKRSRIFTKWYCLRLSEELKSDPDASDGEVFRKVVAKLMSFPKQLDSS